MNAIRDLYNDFKNGLIHLVEEYPLISGIGFLIIGGILLAYQLNKKESLKTAHNGIFSWKVFVNMWAVILMSFIFGLILLIKSLF